MDKGDDQGAPGRGGGEREAGHALGEGGCEVGGEEGGAQA